MSIREKLEAIFNDVTLKGEDADVREYDKEISGYLKDDIDKLFISLIIIMKESEHIPVRRLIIQFWIQKLVFDIKNTPCEYWSKLSKETRDAYKKELFQFLASEPNQSLREEICAVIGGIIITTESLNDEDEDEDEDEEKEPVPEDAKKWPEISNTLETLVSSDSETDKSAAYLITSECFTDDYPIPNVNKQKIETWVMSGLQNSSPKVQIDAIHLLFSMSGMADDEYLNACSLVLPTILGKFKSTIEANPALHQTASEILEYFLNFPDKTQKKHFGELFEIVKLLFNKEDQNKVSINQQLLDLISVLFTSNPSLIAKKKNLIEEFAEMIFYQIALITPDVTEEWARPPEGYNEDEASSKEDRYKERLLEIIRELVAVIPEPDQIVSTFEVRVKHKLETGDWKAKYFDLMLKGQIGGSIDLNEALKLIETSLIHLKDPHPKVRYATIQLIGEYCEDLAPDLQHANPKLLAVLAEGLVKEEVPRVTAHYFSALLNFFKEGVDYSALGTPDLNLLIPLSLKHAVEGISYVRETATSFIGGLSEVIKEHLSPYLSEVMEVILKLAGLASQEYMSLRARALEAATLWVACVPDAESYFEQVIKATIESMNEFLVLDENLVLLKLYVVNAFHRLFMSSSEKSEPHIPEIFPQFIDVCEKMLIPKDEAGVLENILKKAKDKQHNVHEEAGEDEKVLKKQEFFFDEDDICSGLDALNTALTEFPKAMIPYTENFLAFYKNSFAVVTAADHNNILTKLFEGAAALLEIIKENSSKEDFLKIYQELLISSHNGFRDEIQLLEINKDVLKAVQQMYTVAENVLPAEEIRTALLFLEKTYKLLVAKNKLNTTEISEKDLEEEEETDEESKENIKTEIEEEKLALVECLGELVKYNKNVIADIFSDRVISFYMVLMAGAGEDLKSEARYKIVGFPICDLFEFFTPDHPSIKKILDKTFIRILEIGATHDIIACRQTASYAIGIFARNAKVDTFNKYKNKLLELLEQSGTKTQTNYPLEFINLILMLEPNKFLVDNIGAAYGKMLKYKADTLDQKAVMSEWLRYMPLKADQSEMQEQHEFLADLILGPKFEFLCGDDQNRKDIVTQKIIQVREKSEMIDDPVIKRKIENAYLKLVKTG